MSLDRANGGPCPPAEILKAILYGTAAAACRVAGQKTGELFWFATEAEQRRRVRALLGHTLGGSFEHPTDVASGGISNPPSRSTARSSTRTVTLRPE
jgi:hypothetical protein